MVDDDSDKSDARVLDAITKVSQQFETFNLQYLTKVDEKFATIMQTISSLDTNIKQLQEKAQVWEIFRHHVTSWNEHIKSSDNKIDILRKSLENLPVIENQLQNTDFKVQHVFEKADVMNEKLNEITKSLLELRRPPPSLKQKKSDGGKTTGARSWSQEDFEQTEILMRLSKIQRTLQNTCSAIRVGKEIESFKSSKPSSGEVDDETMSVKTLMAKVNSNLEKIPLREIRQSFNLNKKHEKALETLNSVVNHIDERTIRIFDTSSYQFKKLLSCCKSTEHEVLTFTNNANTLLKRTEKALKEVEASTADVSQGEGSKDADGSGGGSDEDMQDDETGSDRFLIFLKL